MNAQQAIAFSIKPLTFAIVMLGIHGCATQPSASQPLSQRVLQANQQLVSRQSYACLLYTSPSPRDKRQSRMPSSA